MLLLSGNLGRNRLLPILTALLLSFAWAGCSPKPAPKVPSEAETLATSIINQRFTEREGRWLALEDRPQNSRSRLIELNKPSIQLDSVKVSDTDRMNGITERHHLAVFCEQYRHWDQSWTEWKTGTGGGKNAVVHAITSGSLAQRRYQLEKKNDEWRVSELTSPPLSTDRQKLQLTISNAFARQQ